MSLRTALAASALLAALPAGAAEPVTASEPATVEAPAGFAEWHIRIGFPCPSVAVLFDEQYAVDLAGLAWPGFEPGVPVAGAGALQAGFMYRYGARAARGASDTLDLRALAGVVTSTGVLESLPPRVVLIPGLIASGVLEWTHWTGGPVGVSAELMGSGMAFLGQGPGFLLRASVGVAF